MQLNPKTTITILLFFICTHAFGQSRPERKFVTIYGTINNLNPKTSDGAQQTMYEQIYVFEKYNMRESLIHQPIKNGRVCFKFFFNDFKQYNISPIPGMSNFRLSFYPDADTIFFSILSDDEIKIKGGKLTNEYINKLNRYYSSFENAYDKIVEKYGEASFKLEKGGKIKINPIAHQKLDSLKNVYYANRFKNNPPSPQLSDYNLFLDKIWIADGVLPEEINDINRVANFYMNHFDNPIYQKLTQTFVADLTAHHTLIEGQGFVNVIVQNQKQENVQLNDFVGMYDYLLLDIWATWCGPCIGKSKKVIPVYKTYHNKGFEVFSIMTEVESFKEYVDLNKKYDYPWAVYSDIDNKNQVRTKYGTNNGGGVQILLNKKGKIVKVNPTAKELEKFLHEKL